MWTYGTTLTKEFSASLPLLVLDDLRLEPTCVCKSLNKACLMTVLFSDKILPGTVDYVHHTIDISNIVCSTNLVLEVARMPSSAVATNI